ncbi:MAG: hypothetical protein Q8P67_01895, partial [archaeon]|nr:hypothetical protein [archaeon]
EDDENEEEDGAVIVIVGGRSIGGSREISKDRLEMEANRDAKGRVKLSMSLTFLKEKELRR